MSIGRAAVLAMFCAAVRAQAPEVTLRTTTRLVQVSVVALDKNRRPVADLAKENFTIAEQGRARPVAFFGVERSRVSSAAPLPANVFSNRPEFASGDVPSNVTVILLDLLNTSMTDRIYARERVLRFLSQTRSEDRVGLYALSGQGLQILHDFTSDTAALLRRIEKVRGGPSRELENSKADPEILKGLEDRGLSTDADKRIANHFLRTRIENTLLSFRSIASHLSGIAGRKNLIWISGTFPLMITANDIRQPSGIPGRGAFDMDQRTFLTELESAVRALNQANVAVYPVDARGLMAPAVRMDERGRPCAAAAVAENIETMTKIAERTGGKAYYNRNDIEGAVREVFEESGVTYTLGYYADGAEPDGKWREIRVSVDRPGVALRHRRGYFALPDAKAGDEAMVQRELRNAVWSPVDSTSIGINARVDTAGGMWNVFLQIDAAAVTLRPESGRWTGHLDIAVVLKSAEGRNIDATFDKIGMNLQEETYRNAMKGGIVYETRLKKRPEAAMLKVVVRDASSGLTGSLTVPAGRLVP